MKEIIEKTEESAEAREKAREKALDELIAYMLGLIARYDDRREYVD